jgi:hypothetical protein
LYVEKIKLMDGLKRLLKRTPLFRLIIWLRRRQGSLDELRVQSRANVYHPSPVHDLIRSIAAENAIKVFFETGTYLGNTVFGVKSAFDEVYSVELSGELAALARERFAKDLNVQIICGDSSRALANFLSRLDRPAVFWLDAHYSAGITAMGALQTPIREELSGILAHPVRQHHILIDDVKDFNGQNDYPTVDEILDTVREFGAGSYRAWVEGSVFRIEPRGSEIPVAHAG